MASWLRKLRRGVPLTVFYDPSYRLPISGLEGVAKLEPRRADFAAWYLVECGAVDGGRVVAPGRVSWADLGLVHTAGYLESLHEAKTLAAIFAVDESDVPVEEVLRTTRLAVGGTVGAARTALRERTPVLNLLGGFHHAAPGHGGGLCPVNDIAVALAVARREGFRGRVAVIDLDAHPPDGTARCFEGDRDVWIGSISGSRWDAMAGVDETVLETGVGDEGYLTALDALLGRMPPSDFAFVVAGGDVLSKDQLGLLGLTLEGVRRRDSRVLDSLDGMPSVWLPGGGYHPAAWMVLAGTGLVLAGKPKRRIPRNYDPLAARFGQIARTLPGESLADETEITQEAIDEELGVPHLRRRTLLRGYTAEGAEYALERYGVLDHLRRLGYPDLSVVFDNASKGQRMRVIGRSERKEHVLVELVVARSILQEKPVLFVNWLQLQNPRVRFAPGRPQLPGQTHPGLGLAREATELLAAAARRLGLSGVAFRPSYFHTAYGARDRFCFIDPERQGRFLAMVRDFKSMPLAEATVAVADGRARLNDQPYAWEADNMVFWLEPVAADDAKVLAAKEAAHFTCIPSVN